MDEGGGRVVVGICDKAHWEERRQVREEELDAIAERMEDIGIRI